MGFFSYRCAASGKPILAGTSISMRPEDLKHLCEVVLVVPKGWVRGTWDGYGRIDGRTYGGGAGEGDVPERIYEDDVKMVLASEFSGQDYDALPFSGSEPKQGHFWDEFELRDVLAGLFPYPYEGSWDDPVKSLQGTRWPEMMARKYEDGEDRDFVGMTRLLRSDLADADERAVASGVLPREDPDCIALRRLGYSIEGDAMDAGVDLTENFASPAP